MRYRMPRRGRRLAAAAIALCCALAVAGPAWADGEDDPAFGDAGTSFVPLADVQPLQDPDGGKFFAALRPRTDQAHDGAIITAIALRHQAGADRGSPDEFVRVTRMDGSGKLAGLDGDGSVDVEHGFINRLLDVEALADGRIVLVTEGDDVSKVREWPTRLQIITLDGSGSVVERNGFLPPDPECDNDFADAEAADVDAAGRVFVAWEDCDGGPVIARYDGEDELVSIVGQDRMAPRGEPSVGLHLVEIALGPDGDLFIFGGGCCAGGSPERGGLPLSAVGRYTTEDLDFDEDYGSGGAAFAPGWPVDMTVDADGRAVVWTDPPEFMTRGDEGHSWDFFRFDPAGDVDPTWGDEGWAEIEHPAIGDVGACFVTICPERPQVVAQGDGKVVAVGYPPAEREPTRGIDEVPEDFKDRTIIRLTTAGALDPAWDGDGVRSFALGQPEGGGAAYLTLGPPALQGDGKLLIPSLTGAGDQTTRVPTPPDGFALGVSRIGVTPPGTPAVQQTASLVSAAAARQCVSRRVFTIRLRTGRKRKARSAIKTATVTVHGKRVPVTRRGGRHVAQVDLRTLPKGRFNVVIRLTLADGGKVRETRRYRTCTSKQARDLPGLRTRKPKAKRR